MRFPPGVEIPNKPCWPLTLRAGGLVLCGLRRSDQRAWHRLRARNERWLAAWDATSPPGAAPPPSYTAGLRAQNRQAKQGELLPLGMWWDATWPEPAPRRSWRLIGQVTVGAISWGSARMAPIGYWIDQEFAGRGLMPTAVALAGDYCFFTLELHRLEINIRPENAASLRVVEKLGFRSEGLRPRLLHINGDWRDHLSFALTAEELGEGLLNRYLAGRRVPSRGDLPG